VLNFEQTGFENAIENCAGVWRSVHKSEIVC
jgi:hypothetical protein